MRLLCNTKTKFLVIKHSQLTAECPCQHVCHTVHTTRGDTRDISASLYEQRPSSGPGYSHSTRHDTARHHISLRGWDFTRECLPTDSQRPLHATAFLSLDNIWPPCQVICNGRAGLPDLQAASPTSFRTNTTQVYLCLVPSLAVILCMRWTSVQS
jgi:hypothetical protein